jgi:hypothetical protein
MNVTDLSLRDIVCLSEEEDGDILRFESVDKASARIVSELVKPSVQRLSLRNNCQLQHFQAALSAQTGTFLSELDVFIECSFSRAREKVDVLRRFIGDAVQLQNLTIITNPQAAQLFRSLVETLEACTTITRLEVGREGNQGNNRTYVGDEDVTNVVQQLRRFAARNEQLALFRASPNTYPNDQLLDLMRQFDNCPTGRYRLACSLPGVFTFQRGDSVFQ